MCPGSAVLCPPAFSVKPPLRPGYDRPRLEANRQKPQRLVSFRPPFVHLVHGESRLDARIDEVRHWTRKGIDHDRLAGGLILNECGACVPPSGRYGRRWNGSLSSFPHVLFDNGPQPVLSKPFVRRYDRAVGPHEVVRGIAPNQKR